MREQVVDVEMELGNEPDAVPAIAVYRKHRLGSELDMLARPDEARINRPGGPASMHRRRQAEFHDGRQVRNEAAEMLVANIVLQIEQTVFDRAAPFDRLGLIAAAGNGVADGPSDCEG